MQDTEMKTNKSIEYSKSGNVVYYIDHDNRTIIAKIKCSCQEPMLLFEKQMFKHIASRDVTAPVGCNFSFTEDFLIKPNYIGKARCHPSDKFDIGYGKQLALLRAKTKYREALYAQYDKIFMWMTELNTRCYQSLMKLNRNVIDTWCQLYAVEEEARGSSNGDSRSK